MSDLKDRQNRLFEAAKVPSSVAIAIDCWVIYMRGGEVAQWYPNHSSGMVSGGIHCVGDMEDEATYYAARAVDGIVRGFSSPQKDAINVVFLGCKTNFRLMDIDGMVIDLLPIIYRGLVAKGVA